MRGPTSRRLFAWTMLSWVASTFRSKAKTARFFNMPTGKLGELAQPGKPLYNIEFSNGGLITFPEEYRSRTRVGTSSGRLVSAAVPLRMTMKLLPREPALSK